MREVSEWLGTQPNRISEWENGIMVPKLTTLIRYGALFDLTVSQLLKDVM